MNKLSLLAIFIAFFLLNCHKAPTQEPSTTLNTPESSTPSPGVMPQTRLNTYMFNPQNYSWKDVDKFYREDILIKCQGEPYYNNLRKTAIFSLVNQFQLLENADLPTIEFYANELMNINLPDLGVFLKVMKRLEGHWPDSKIQDYALQKRDSTISYIQNNFKEPKKLLDQQKENLENITKFAENL
ncbi:MAG: hypothetical protein IT259_13995 [Saprospiraceae bacterium]|nr:hypothetical protein [Saprospiraceae bacterium]